MKRVCQHCKTVYGHKPGPADEETHGICPVCMDKNYPGLRERMEAGNATAAA